MLKRDKHEYEISLHNLGFGYGWEYVITLHGKVVGRGRSLLLKSTAKTEARLHVKRLAKDAKRKTYRMKA
ncbi:hypothetical protein ASD62_14105 [Phycicoccus sp. Root563]|nr:hypothetical protein ASD62_14105 [Phycicoccus sp. Root563]